MTATETSSVSSRLVHQGIVSAIIAAHEFIKLELTPWFFLYRFLYRKFYSMLWFYHWTHGNAVVLSKCMAGTPNLIGYSFCLVLHCFCLVLWWLQTCCVSGCTMMVNIVISIRPCYIHITMAVHPCFLNEMRINTIRTYYGVYSTLRYLLVLWWCIYINVIPHIFGTCFTIGIYLSRTRRCGNYRKFRRVIGQVMECHMCRPSIGRWDQRNTRSCCK
jgi:hypothetical protein